MDDERYAISDTVQYLVELCDVKLQQPARRQTTPPRQRAGAWFAGWLARWLVGSLAVGRPGNDSLFVMFDISSGLSCVVTALTRR